MRKTMERMQRVGFFILYKSVSFFIHVGEFTKGVGIKMPLFLSFFVVYSIHGSIRLLIFIIRISIFILLLPYRIFIALLSVRIRYFFLGFLICFIVLFMYQSYITVLTLPTPEDIGKINYSLSTHIYDRNGKLLYEIYHDQNRTPIQIKKMPSYIAQAAISIEDKDFYNHNGISLTSGILRAIKDMIKTHSLQGGSTITQQLVKSALLSPERTLQRKMKEIILALWTERIFSKQQILEMYINQVAYGGSSYGIEEAAKTYFGKHAEELTLDEAALLAGLPQAPSLYSPFTNPQLAIARRNNVLDKMYEYGYINSQERDAARKTELHIIPPQTPIKAPHFVFYVKGELEKMYGTKQVEEGGMHVYTTLDLTIQEQAEKILQEELDKVKYLNVTNGAILVTKPFTGEILAMVGSSEYFKQQYGAFNVTTALRQPGSSIKPIMYSLALSKGFTAATTIDDTPVVFPIAGSESYRPLNYDDRFHGKVTLRQALANSYNIPAIKVLNTIGVQEFVNTAQEMGITTWTDPSRYGLSMTLGSVEVRMTDMATAFGVFANQGYKVQLANVTHIDDFHGKTIYKTQSFKTRALDSGISYIISDILSDNFARILAFGPNNALEIPGYKVAVKTGTTDEKKDNWTIGYTPDYLVAVWVGNSDNTAMNKYLASGVTGAAPIWNRVMKYVLSKEHASHQWFTQPEDIVQKICYFGRNEYFIRGTENTVPCITPGQQPQPTLQSTILPVSPTLRPSQNNTILIVPNNRGRKKRQ